MERVILDTDRCIISDASNGSVQNFESIYVESGVGTRHSSPLRRILHLYLYPEFI